MQKDPRAILIRPNDRMPSTATRRTGGIGVYIGIVKDKDGKWCKVERLRHVPFRIEKDVEYFHSPDGFNIGYGGSGPADLALAICALFRKPHLYQEFKWKVIANLKKDVALDIPFDHIKIVLEQLETKGHV